MTPLAPNLSLSGLYDFVSRRPSSPEPEHSEQQIVLRSDSANLTLENAPKQNQQMMSVRPTADMSVTHPVAQEAQLELTAPCTCGQDVRIKVPQWFHPQQQTPLPQLQAYPAAEWDPAQTEAAKREKFRTGVVNWVVVAATAFRDSRFPEMILNFFKLLFAWILWLDLQFKLREKALRVFWHVISDLVRIEREVGLFRNSGEAISVFWEAAVKGTIALAKAEPSPAAATPQQTRPTYPAQHTASYTAPQYHSYPTPDQFPASQYLHPHYQQQYHPQQYDPQYTSLDHDSEFSAGASSENSSSETEQIHSRAAARNSSADTIRRRLRRTAHSTPSFHDQSPLSASGASTPAGYFGGSERPKMGNRRRSRSGPEGMEDSAAQARRPTSPSRDNSGYLSAAGRGWAQMVTNAVGKRVGSTRGD